MDVMARMLEHPLVSARMLRDGAGVHATAWILAAIEACLYPLTLYLGLMQGTGVSASLQFGWWGALSPLLAIEFGTVGALVLRRHQRHGLGLVATVGAFCLSLSAFAGAYGAYSLTHENLLPAAGFAVWLRGWIWYPATSLLFILTPALFPDGRLPSHRWKPIVWAVAVGNLAQFLWVTLSQLMFGHPIVDGPYPAMGWLFDVLTPLSGVLWLLPLFAAAAAIAVRFRRSRGLERQQLKWFLAAVGFEAAVWAGAVIAGAVTRQSSLYQIPYFDILLPLALLTMPPAIAIAILRHRLYDVDIVISRGLVFAGLAAFITAAYVLIVIGIGLAVGTGGRPNLVLSVVAMALVVVLVHPVRTRLQEMANRLVYGGPRDPYAVLAEISNTAATGDVDSALARIAQAFAVGIGSRKTRIRLLLPGGQARVATWPAGAEGPFGKVDAVTYGEETVGEIEADGSSGHQLAGALMAQAAHALHTLRLGAELDARLEQLEAQAHELTASRARLVQAQESERRRLERDLHDGIQQELVVLIAKARLARNQLDRDPRQAAQTLAELQGGAQHALADLRSLARGIHPALLTSSGLVEAIEAMAARLPMSIRIDADQSVRRARYVPEIEGAAYFVVAEGLANVLKHSGASEATVSLKSSDSCLDVTVADDGRGFDQGVVHESGLRGLRDRVEALGGHFEIASAGSGTRLTSTFPTASRLDV